MAAGHVISTVVMGPHARKLSIQQSTNITCDGSASLKLLIGRRIDEDVKR
jgi:hypothetical protein